MCMKFVETVITNDIYCYWLYISTVGTIFFTQRPQRILIRKLLNIFYNLNQRNVKDE